MATALGAAAVAAATTAPTKKKKKLSQLRKDVTVRENLALARRFGRVVFASLLAPQTPHSDSRSVKREL